MVLETSASVAYAIQAGVTVHKAKQPKDSGTMELKKSCQGGHGTASTSLVAHLSHLEKRLL